MSLPYFPMYPADFEAKTSHLTLAEDGAYNRLLRICWMTPGCTIPTDETWIMRRVRAHTDDEKEAVRAVLAEFFTIEKGRYSNAKLMRIWHEANEAHEKRKNAGARGGKAKALKTNKSEASNAVAKPKQPEPEPEPDIKEEPKGSLSSGDDDAKPFDEIAECVAEYNGTARECGWPEIRVLSKARRSALVQRLRESGGIDGWRHALAKARASPHCCGQNDRGWTANFDFLTRQSSFAKLMEGNYDNRAGKSNTGTDAAARQISYAARFGRSPSTDCF